MDVSLVKLELFLDAMGIVPEISDLDGRKLIQKAVYLGQALTNLDLGYRFGWYVMGPYSTELTKDYYKLEAIKDAGQEDEESDLALPATEKAYLSEIAAKLNKPEGIAISEADWMEIVASVHFLENVSRKSSEETKDFLQRVKPHLSGYIDSAEATLGSITAA